MHRRALFGSVDSNQQYKPRFLTRIAYVTVYAGQSRFRAPVPMFRPINYFVPLFFFKFAFAPLSNLRQDRCLATGANFYKQGRRKRGRERLKILSILKIFLKA